MIFMGSYVSDKKLCNIIKGQTQIKAHDVKKKKLKPKSKRRHSKQSNAIRYSFFNSLCCFLPFAISFFITGKLKR